MMKVNDFLIQVEKAVKAKTLYVMGGFGACAGYGRNRERYSSNNDYNKQPARQKLIKAASDDTFFFDCVGLCKGILWGWDALTDRIYGGAGYSENGVPDFDAKGMMFKGCTEQSKDFSKIEAGEFLWLDGHCGIYIGGGLAVESSPKWADGVQVTAVLNMGRQKGYNGRTWTYHGHLKYVDYTVKPQPQKYPDAPFTIDVLGEKECGLRTGPYSSCSYMGEIKKGKYTVKEVSGDYGRIDAWIYLDTDKIDIPGQTIDGYTIGNSYSVICSELNVRVAATTDSDVVTKLNRGAVVVCKSITHDDKGNTWMRIESPAAGWVCAIYGEERYIG